MTTLSLVIVLLLLLDVRRLGVFSLVLIFPLLCPGETDTVPTPDALGFLEPLPLPLVLLLLKLSLLVLHLMLLFPLLLLLFLILLFKIASPKSYGSSSYSYSSTILFSNSSDIVYCLFISCLFNPYFSLFLLFFSAAISIALYVRLS